MAYGYNDRITYNEKCDSFDAFAERVKELRELHKDYDLWRCVFHNTNLAIRPPDTMELEFRVRDAAVEAAVRD